jgi:hypothetical protein
MRKWLIRLAGLMVALAALLTVIGLVSTGFGRSMGGSLSGDRLARAEASENFADGKFVNPTETPITAPGQGWEGLTRAFTEGSERTPAREIPVVQRTASDFSLPPAAGLEVTWIGHGTSIEETSTPGSPTNTSTPPSVRERPARWASSPLRPPAPPAKSRSGPSETAAASWSSSSARPRPPAATPPARLSGPMWPPSRTARTPTAL